MILSVPIDLEEEEQQVVIAEIMSGFKELAAIAQCRLTIESINFNPWCMVGGIASSVCERSEIIMPKNAQPGDVLILTKPLGVQLASNVPNWMEENSDNWKKIREHLTTEELLEAHEKAVKSMTTLNLIAARLMHKYEAHASTDVTGFGIVGHAENLLQYQEQKLDFIFKTFPVIKHVKKIAQILNRHQKLLAGRMVETSGGLLISLPKHNAQSFCEEFKKLSGSECWIVGHVQSGSGNVKVDDADILEV